MFSSHCTLTSTLSEEPLRCLHINTIEERKTVGTGIKTWLFTQHLYIIYFLSLAQTFFFFKETSAWGAVRWPTLSPIQRNRWRLHFPNHTEPGSHMTAHDSPQPNTEANLWNVAGKEKNGVWLAVRRVKKTSRHTFKLCLPNGILKWPTRSCAVYILTYKELDFELEKIIFF